MAVKRFGPVLGAGVQLTEKEGDVPIEAAPLGVTALVGEFVKGEPGEPGFPGGKIDFQKRYGSTLLPDSDAPKAADDFYKNGRGAGELIPWRVTAGDEVKSWIYLHTRQGISSPQSSGRNVLGRLLAKNGGKWGGQRNIYLDDITGASDLTATTLDTGDVMLVNEWTGGTLQLKKVTTKTYKIVSNTAAGVLTVEADQDLLTDWNAGGGTPANRYVLTKDNVDHLENEQSLAVKIVDGEENPSTEFGLIIYENGEEVYSKLNLSTDPTKVNYWINVINDDQSNYWISALDDFTGDKTVAAVRPANFYGESDTLTLTVLTLPDPDVVISSPGGADPTVTITSIGSLVRSQTLTGTVSNTGADIDWVTTLGPLALKQTTFDGVPYTELGNEIIDSITITNGGTALADGDTITITIIALEPDELIGGKVWPDVVNEPNLSFVISDNDRQTVTVRAGLDLTNDGAIAAGEIFKLEYQQEFEKGLNGSPVSDFDFNEAFDASTSTLNKIFGKNKGLVKIASPGITSTSVTKAGLEYAAARNYQYLVEIPASITSESDAIDHINTTIGRSDYGLTYLPSFGSVQDPETLPGVVDIPLKQQSLSGMILGRHALVAKNYEGYHKAPSDITITLPDVLQLPTGDSETAIQLNEEMLNPKGINVIKFRQGNVIVWGDRTISLTTEWKWLHQRSQMSYYENILRENYDWIIFAINNERADSRLRSSLISFFLPEWRPKEALRGDTFDDAFQLKMDEENNTDATAAAGDKNAEITLKLAETIERFRIIIGKAGIFDAAQ